MYIFNPHAIAQSSSFQSLHTPHQVMRVTSLTPEARESWRAALTQYDCTLDTNIFMCHCVETTNTVMSAIEEILTSQGSFILACAETRLELESISQRMGAESQALAACGLQWYQRLRSKRLLVEEEPFQYMNGSLNGYADAAVLIRMMAHLLLRRPTEKPRAFISRDSRLNKDLLALNSLKTLSRARVQEPICVLHVNKYGSIVPFDPAHVSQQPQQQAAPEAAGGSGALTGGFVSQL